MATELNPDLIAGEWRLWAHRFPFPSVKGFWFCGWALRTIENVKIYIQREGRSREEALAKAGQAVLEVS